MNEKMQELIKELINYEPDENSKLDMLTSISITTQNEDLHRASEEVRNELCRYLQELERLHNDLQGKSNPESAELAASEADHGTNGSGLFV